MRHCTILLLTPLLLAQPGPPRRAPGNETILKQQLKADLYFLAGDAMRGRLTGSAEYELTAEYIASRFERMGLLPAVGDSYSHRYDLVLSRLGEPNALRLTQGTSERHGRVLEDFYPLIFSASGRAQGAAVFAGYGVHAPDLGWSDYEGKNVAGKIVIVLDGDPQSADPKSAFDGVVTSEYANSLRKTLAAQERGAAAILIVDGNAAAKPGAVTDGFRGAARTYWPAKPPHLEKYTLAVQANRIRIPALQISPALAAHLLGKPLPVAAADRDGGAGAFTESNAQVDLTANVRRSTVEDRNIVARIEGSDPKLKDEAVIVSAHYDHNGTEGSQIFNGADDNGSGVVALLEIAEAYALAAERGQRPRRTVIFASWGSEERCCGPLLGAWAWVEDAAASWPVERTVATLNMDMIGRSEEVPEYGGRRFNGLGIQTAASNANNVNILGWSYSPDLSKLVDESNHSSDLRLLRRYDNNKSQLLRRSDQWPFLQRRVPALFFHSGLHPDYHTTNDRPERIDYGKVERVARLVHQLSWDLATRDGRPAMPARRVIPQ